MSREGFIFVMIDGQEDDVFVKASKMKGALNGDTVKVVVTRPKGDRNRREGAQNQRRYACKPPQHLSHYFCKIAIFCGKRK